MMDNGYIYAIDNKRIFINTSLGCLGQCEYCYLPKVGYGNKKDVDKKKNASEIIKMIEESDIKLDSDTLITIGCYSECWDQYNKDETIKIVKFFLKRGNQVQLSTKMKILESELEELLPLIMYYGQLVIYVSSATISQQEKIEKNTTKITERFSNFEVLKKLNIPSVLYMKPVLEGITIKDLELYKKYINELDIKDVVVGSMFTTEEQEEEVHFLKSKKLFYKENSDEDKIILELEKITNVYRRSSEVMKKYKKSVE